jgi:immune inhibitor A
MPPHPDLTTRIERGEIPVPMPLAEREALLRKGIDAPDRPLRLRGAGLAAADSFRTLAILVRFSDVAAQVSPAKFDTLLYGSGTGSVRDYYSEISYGKLDMITVDLPSTSNWQTAPQTKSYYANSQYGFGAYPQNAQKLVQDAVATADAIVDFSQYDNDGDGWLDALMIIHTGPGAEYTGNANDIWSHKWGISTQIRDGVYLSSYAMMPEYWTTPGDMTIGVFAHELGHVFGLPDLYDTDYSSRGIGRWSLMAVGSWNGSMGNSPSHPDAWCRVQLGFTTPIVPTSQANNAQFPQIETDTVIYRLWDGGAAGPQYFLVENRQRVGFDAGLPAAGMLVWHIDEDVSTDNDEEWYPGSGATGHYLVALKQADGIFHLEKNLNSGDAADVFPGSTDNRAFNATTAPNSLKYDSTVSYVAISNISGSDSLMTADLTVSLVLGVDDDGTRPVSAFLARNYPNPFNASTRIEAALTVPGQVTTMIFDVLGRRVRVLNSTALAPGQWSQTWNGTDDAGHELSSGVYWYRVIAPNAQTTGKMLMLK